MGTARSKADVAKTRARRAVASGGSGERRRLTRDAVVRGESAPPVALMLPPSTTAPPPLSACGLSDWPPGPGVEDPLETMAMALINVPLLSVLSATSSASISIREFTAVWASRVVGNHGSACRHAANAQSRRS